MDMDKVSMQQMYPLNLPIFSELGEVRQLQNVKAPQEVQTRIRACLYLYDMQN